MLHTGHATARMAHGKKKTAKKIILVIITALLLLGSAFSGGTPAAYAQDHEEYPVALNIVAEAAILIDADTGQILYRKNENALLPPASMVKMMTEYLVMEEIKKGTIQWDSRVTISKYAAAIPGSGGLLAEGEIYTVKDLFRQVTIFSANDATVALAEYIAGSEERFVHMMNEKAREFGLSEGAHFVNSTGLNKADTGEYTPNIPGESVFSAKDAAIIARRIISDHPEILEFTKIPQAHARENDPNSEIMLNWNRIVEGWMETDTYFASWAYPGVDGLKTGHTKEAGWCFTGTAKRGDRRLISVVMNTESEKERFDQTKKLFDFGFNNYEKMVIVPGKSKLSELETVPVSKGKKKQVAVVTKTGAEALVMRGTTADQFEIKVEMAAEDRRVAPIKTGDVLGTATFTYTGDEFELPPVTVELVAAENVEKAGWFTLFFRGIGEFFANLFKSILDIF